MPPSPWRFTSTGLQFGKRSSAAQMHTLFFLSKRGEPKAPQSCISNRVPLHAGTGSKTWIGRSSALTSARISGPPPHTPFFRIEEQYASGLMLYCSAAAATSSPVPIVVSPSRWSVRLGSAVSVSTARTRSSRTRSASDASCMSRWHPSSSSASPTAIAWNRQSPVPCTCCTQNVVFSPRRLCCGSTSWYTRSA